MERVASTREKGLVLAPAALQEVFLPLETISSASVLYGTNYVQSSGCNIIVACYCSWLGCAGSIAAWHATYTLAPCAMLYLCKASHVQVHNTGASQLYIQLAP